MTYQTIKNYYSLTKPGIIYGNVLNTVGGFLLTAKSGINPALFLAMIVGTSLIVGSACVFNNFLDRGIDNKMARTRQRTLVQQKISVTSALLFGTVLLFLGVYLLSTYTNILTLSIGLLGFFGYVVVYGITKRTSIHGTIIGSVAGAVPPLAGYTAVTNQIDMAGLLLFLSLVCWQMPHFYAVAIYRIHDYSAAGLPVLPVKKGIETTKWHMLWYAIGFLLFSCLLTVFGYTGLVYLVVMATLGFLWLRMSILGFYTENNIQWARTIFRFSLIIIVAFCFLLSATLVLP